nr:unnamed protein product [Spirometra erinaceieuropaei]
MANSVSPYPTDGLSGNCYDGLSAVNGLIVDGAYLDGSWELCVHVEDVNSDVSMRVRGDMSLGGLMHLIVESIDVKQSWSDHAIWWPQRNMWLLHTRTSLDQYGVQSDARLVFRRTHGNLQVVLPSMATLVLRVNFASRVFSVVESICKELCIRHHEELSLMFPIKRETLKSNSPLPVIRHGVRKTGPLTAIGSARSDMPSVHNGLGGAVSTIRLTGEPASPNPYATLPYGSATLMRRQSDNSLDEERLDIASFADCGQRRPAKTVFAEEWLLKPKNVQQKARMDGSWLDSSRSLMEHGVEPPPLVGGCAESSKPPTLYLRFKYYSFYDLNVNYDAVRIHQLYEQARWSLLSGGIECTEDEMVVFASYQLQAELQSQAAANFSFPNFPSGTGTLAHYATVGGGGSANFNTLGSTYETGGFSPMTPDYTLNSRLASPRSAGGSLMRLPSLGVVSPIRPLSPLLDSPQRSPFPEEGETEDMDEIDYLLTNLEQSCNVTRDVSNRKGTNRPNAPEDSVDSTIPVLQDFIKVFRDRVLMMRRYKEMWAVVRNGNLYLYQDSRNTSTPNAVYALRDCLVNPDVNSANMRFDVRLLLVADPDSASAALGTATTGRKGRAREEMYLRFHSAEQYAKWVAAFRLAARGKTLSSRTTYDREVELNLDLIRKQASRPVPSLSPTDLATHLDDLTDYCAERIIRKAKSKEALRQRISETHAELRDLSLLDAKLRYIQDWQRLNHFGRSYFIVQFDKGNSFGLGVGNSGLFANPSPPEDIIAVRQGRIEVVSSTSEEAIMAWNFTNLRCWNVNWDNGRVVLEFRNGKVSFRPLSANCKTVMECIGGYVFLSQRTPEKNQTIDERVFHKLTGGND